MTAAATAYALSIGRGPAGSAFVGTAVLAGQCSIGWHNDALDAERDQAAGRRDKPAAQGLVTRRVLALSAALAAVATVPLSLASGWRAALVHLIAVAWAWAYNLRLKASPLSFVPYMVAFGLLPCFVTLGAAGSPLPPWWVPAATALLGLAAHLANSVPDLEVDRLAGVVGLPHRLGRTGSLALAAAALAGAALLLGLGPRGSLGLLIAGIVVAAAGGGGAFLLALSHPNSRRPFALVVLVAMADIGLLLSQGHLGG
ncbi:MAG: 4-hydroxybenzoate polyprenyltransferase-like prenyltransferase [Acidimicrobiaceae bacterium]|nr:4-hydroxybenzoate polyprenyltransferase-like prenyltransferase [Acidimicrobiaceae bacterium]